MSVLYCYISGYWNPRHMHHAKHTRTRLSITHSGVWKLRRLKSARPVRNGNESPCCASAPVWLSVKRVGYSYRPSPKAVVRGSIAGIRGGIPHKSCLSETQRNPAADVVSDAVHAVCDLPLAPCGLDGTREEGPEDKSEGYLQGSVPTQSMPTRICARIRVPTSNHNRRIWQPGMGRWPGGPTRLSASSASGRTTLARSRRPGSDLGGR